MAVALTFGLCNRSTVFSQYRHTSLMGWEKNDTLVFALQPSKADVELKEIVGIRINDSYPFKAICLIVDQTIMPGNITTSDTVNWVLFDNYGNTKGRGISSYQYNYHLKNNKLMKGDSLTVKIRHNMKREIMPGISDIGIKLERVNF